MSVKQIDSDKDKIFEVVKWVIENDPEEYNVYTIPNKKIKAYMEELRCSAVRIFYHRQFNGNGKEPFDSIVVLTKVGMPFAATEEIIFDFAREPRLYPSQPLTGKDEFTRVTDRIYYKRS